MYYEVQCDHVNPEGVRCATKTSDLGHDFSAWADHGQALDDWLSHDGSYDEKTGETFCYDHIPKCAGCGILLVDEEHEDDCPTWVKDPYNAKALLDGKPVDS
jgi:hypothetical protein